MLKFSTSTCLFTDNSVIEGVHLSVTLHIAVKPTYLKTKVYTMTTFNHYTHAFPTIGTILAICPPISNDHSVNYVDVGS